MTMSVAIAPGRDVGYRPARTFNFTATVSNSGTASVVLTSLFASMPTGAGTVGQPTFTYGAPVILASGAASFPFSVVFHAPANAGPSPQNPGGAAPSPTMISGGFVLQVDGRSDDGSTFSAQTFGNVLAGAFSVPAAGANGGGALALNHGFDLINFITL